MEKCDRYSGVRCKTVKGQVFYADKQSQAPTSNDHNFSEGIFYFYSFENSIIVYLIRINYPTYKLICNPFSLHLPTSLTFLVSFSDYTDWCVCHFYLFYCLKCFFLIENYVKLNLDISLFVVNVQYLTSFYRS